MPSGHHPQGGGRLGTGSGSLTGHPGGGAATALLGSLLSSLIKGPPGLDRNLGQGPDRRPIHFQLLIHPGEARDKRLRRPQGHFRNWGTMR